MRCGFLARTGGPGRAAFEGAPPETGRHGPAVRPDLRHDTHHDTHHDFRHDTDEMTRRSTTAGRRTLSGIALAVIAACTPADSDAPASDAMEAAAAAAGAALALGPVDAGDPRPWDPERIAVGTEAPDFRLESYRGDTLSLSEFSGKREVLLVFYRGAW